MLLKAIRGKTECPRRVSVSLTAGFDSHRLHCFALLFVGGVSSHAQRGNHTAPFTRPDGEPVRE
jgi:hypothetical protein